MRFCNPGWRAVDWGSTIRFYDSIMPKQHLIYRSLTLVLAICEGRCELSKNKFSSFYSSTYPQGIWHLWKKFNRKIHEKVITHFVEFWGFMVCKTMPSGWLELCARSKKKKTYFWDIHSFLLRMLGLKWDYCTWIIVIFDIVFFTLITL